MKKILVPVSFSEASKNALLQADMLSKQTGASLSLLHCYHPQPFAREYDFDDEDYDVGVRKMLIDFYTTTLEATGATSPTLITFAGSVSEILPDISPEYDLLILSRKPGSELNFTNWFTEKIFYIATKALCPVLITASDRMFFPDAVTSIWHIRRNEHEAELVARKLQKLNLDPQLVTTKSLQQTSFISEFWKKIVTYSADQDDALLKDLDHAFEQETIDLLVVVNHRKGLFESFVKADAFRIINEFNIPVLIFQPDPEINDPRPF
ncbi:MAG: universal stress protein [Saprospiraceae bacterium]|nr:universal stress protein [Saprospiraceae bacterium]